ncbi:MAG: hypothetical protein AAGK02_15245 [Pseudomonadota bacterium]
MAQNDPKSIIEAAIKELKRKGINTAQLEARLRDNSIDSLIVGKWPPDDDDDDDRLDALIKTRALFQETLDRVLASSNNLDLVLPLNERVKDISSSLTKSIDKKMPDKPGGDLHRSIVGRWPPD